MVRTIRLRSFLDCKMEVRGFASGAAARSEGIAMIRMIRDYSLLLAFSGASWGLGQAAGGIGVIRRRLDGLGGKEHVTPELPTPRRRRKRKRQ